MKPTDFRNETFRDHQKKLTGELLRAFEIWQRYPGRTTLEAAALGGMNPFTLRPRTTDLCNAGFVTLCDEQPDKREGRYRACTIQETADWFERNRIAATGNQMQLC